MKWEYKIGYPAFEKKQDVLTEHGQDGWELTAVLHVPMGGIEYYFKRPLPEELEEEAEVERDPDTTPITDLIAIVLPNLSVKLTWVWLAAPYAADFVNYVVERAEDKDFGESILFRSNTTEYVDNLTKRWATYYYRVSVGRRVETAGERIYSDVVRVKFA